jgi:hypothetical protein
MSIVKRLAGVAALLAAVLLIAAPASAAPVHPDTSSVGCTSTDFAVVDAFTGVYCYAYAGHIVVDEQAWNFSSGNNAGYFVFHVPDGGCIGCTQPFHKYQTFHFNNSIHIETLYIN